jgi:hypothetical protein
MSKGWEAEDWMWRGKAISTMERDELKRAFIQCAKMLMEHQSPEAIADRAVGRRKRLLGLPQPPQGGVSSVEVR